MRVAAGAGADDDDLATEARRDAALDLVVRQGLGAHLGDVDGGDVDLVPRLAVDDEERCALGARLHGRDEGLGQAVHLGEALGGLARRGARGKLEDERELDHAVALAIPVGAEGLAGAAYGRALRARS